MICSKQIFGNDENTSLEAKENLVFYFPQLGKVIESIEARSPSLKILKQSENEAYAKTQIAESLRGTKVNLSIGSHSIHEDRPGQNYQQSFRTIGSIFLKKPLYHWGGLKAKSKIAKLSENYAKQESAIFKHSLISEIKSEYTDLVLLNYKLKLEKKVLNFSQENETEVIKKQERGLKTKLDVNDAAIKRLNQAIIIAETERIFSQKKSLFQFETGFLEDLSYDISTPFLNFCKEHQFHEKNIPQFIASSTSSEIEKLKTLIKSENENIKVAESSLKPKLNLIGAVYQDQIDLPNNPDSVRRNNFLAGLEVTWAIWDSSLSKAEKSLAITQKRKFEIQLEDKVRHLRVEIENLRSELKSLANQIKLSRQLLKSAHERQEISQINFDQNKISANELLLSKINLHKAEASLIEIVFKYLNAKYQFQLYSLKGNFKNNEVFK